MKIESRDFQGRSNAVILGTIGISYRYRFLHIEPCFINIRLVVKRTMRYNNLVWSLHDSLSTSCTKSNYNALNALCKNIYRCKNKDVMIFCGISQCLNLFIDKIFAYKKIVYHNCESSLNAFFVKFTSILG